MLPVDKHWHNGYRSNVFIQCPNSNSCPGYLTRQNLNTLQREILFSNVTERLGFLSQEVNVTCMQEMYMDEQCEAGYRGPLCGACDRRGWRPHELDCANNTHT